MKKISLKDVKNSLKRDEMRMISGGCGDIFGPDCKDSWGQPCGAHGVCSANFQCPDPNYSTCYHGYCLHVG